ncbi:TetR/AcrR family transcriptional regulator C-terminal domain-containing protein [Streptomyces sp. NPDC047097]|uniref:TetR/AcrR family transcriptional regulator n=1 Tax=Streptomyces sp. NPDC047097 TaxID=3155260 RepID=UPI0033EA9FE9
MASAADRTRRPGRTSVWLEDGGKAGRSPRRTGKTEGTGKAAGTDQAAGLDRDRITAAAVRLLDAAGPEAFSMRRLAAALDVTAMSVYWYVDTKDELLELALDSVFGEMRLPDTGAPGADWREQLRAMAVTYRETLVRHPWVSPLIGRFLNIGPHSLAFARTVQEIVVRTGVPPEGHAGAIAAVFQFVYGFGTIEGHYRARSQSAGLTPDEFFQRSMEALEHHPDGRQTFELGRQIMAARGGDTVDEMFERDFAFALRVLVAGIEAMRDG